MIQTELFPIDTKDASYQKAFNEYRFFVSRGSQVHLVLVKKENRYSVCFNSRKFIENKLSNVYKIIPC